MNKGKNNHLQSNKSANSAGKNQPNKRLRPRTERRSLRRWQMKAKRRYFANLDNSREQLITATPGSGKSLVTGDIGREMLETGKVNRIVVVVPTENLKLQWARVFDRFGIDLDPNWSNSAYQEAKDYLGVIVTYQQVSAEPSIYDFNCRQSSTFVIFDEIHHAADGLDWGDKLRTAFGNADYILSLSGTPFRHDGHAIPFVRYHHNKSQADFSYSYGEALADGVCRPIYFPSYEGSATWLDGAGQMRDRSMFTDSSKTEASQLLNALLDPEGDWLRTILKEANEKLIEFRELGHSAAGGLVIARDQFHARRIGKLLKKICGEEPVIVISDEAEEASRRLKEFSRDDCSRRWIVAVRMVSEGIDIPRLRVGVYATNILSELFFRQAVGRFVRMIPGLDEQSAAFYMPAHPALIRHALAIKEEREHFLPHVRNKIRSGQGSSTIFDPGNNPSKTDEADSNEIGNIEKDEFEKCFIDDFDEEKFTADGTTQFPPEAFGEIVFDSTNSNQHTTTATDETVFGQNGTPPVISRQVIVTVKSEARFHETIFDGLRFSDSELKTAEDIGRKIGAKIPPEQVAAIIRRAMETNAAEHNPDDKQISVSQTDEIPRHSNINKFGSDVQRNKEGLRDERGTLSEQKKTLRSLSNRLVNKLAGRLNISPDVVHRTWIRQYGGVPNEKATLEDLQKKFDWVRTQLNRKTDFGSAKE